MRNGSFVVALFAVFALLAGFDWLPASPVQDGAAGPAARELAEPTRLAIVWTSGDPDVAHRMTLMYAGAAKRNGWFDEVRLVIWGPSQRLVVADKDVRAYIERLIEGGVVVEACLACADSYGIAEDLRAIPGVEVRYMGGPVSEFLKSEEWEVVTF